MQDELNERPSIVRLKNTLVGKIPYTPNSAESKIFLLGHDIGDLLHIYHFWRQRFLHPVVRRYHAPRSVRNDPLYVCNKAKINALRHKIEVGEDLSAYLSRRAHNNALDIRGYRESKSFNSSRDQMLICEGFYHLHLAPLPDRTNEVLVARVDVEVFEVVGVFTHELFLNDQVNLKYTKYNQAVDRYLARRMPEGGFYVGGAGGGLQNLAGSSFTTTMWQIHCRKILQLVEAWPDGIDGFTIKLYDLLFSGRKLRYVDPIWLVVDDGRLLIRDRKNKHDFWMETSGKWRGEPYA
ncbi:hypothetical protein [Acidovorax sp. PRC11]|uniref:hypothetical protein n=1 Tax=Acidovorax sp. PRC11 TaxID=2962592 RepID=UPI00288105B1|nr:hypothetical protein [Acidovorax sp. PRC11]MDT0140220.1 hypothetical protein [Acidovorax sp. PRC11]